LAFFGIDVKVLIVGAVQTGFVIGVLSVLAEEDDGIGVIFDFL
jgi:hypothetical protein